MVSSSFLFKVRYFFSSSKHLDLFQSERRPVRLGALLLLSEHLSRNPFFGPLLFSYLKILVFKDLRRRPSSFPLNSAFLLLQHVAFPPPSPSLGQSLVFPDCVDLFFPMHIPAPFICEVFTVATSQRRRSPELATSASRQLRDVPHRVLGLVLDPLGGSKRILMPTPLNSPPETDCPPLRVLLHSVAYKVTPPPFREEGFR